MRTESRFEQYDLNLVLPEPLIARNHRYVLDERVGAQGQVLRPLDRAEVAALADRLRGYESIAVGLLHAYANDAHEKMVAEVLAERLPGVTAVALVPGLAADARIRALQHGLRQRLCQAADAGLSRPPARAAGRHRRQRAGVPDALGRRHHRPRERGRVPRAAGRVRPRRRRDLRRPHRRAARAEARAQLRHGRDHGQDLPDPRPHAQDQPRLRGGAHLPLQEGLGHADLGPRHRHGRDRRRRRLARPCRRDAPDPGRAGERRVRSRAGLLRARRHAAGRDGCRPGARTPRPGIFRGRHDRPFGRSLRAGAAARTSVPSWAWTRSRPPSRSRRSSTRTWPTPPAPMRSRTARIWPATR